MGVIAKYKFNNTLEANLLPEFNSEFTSDLYTVTDEVNGEVTTRTIESDSLPTSMRFGRVYISGESATDNRTDSLLEVLDMNTSGLTNCNSMFRYNKNLTSITCEWDTSNATNMSHMFNNCNNLTSLDVSNFNTSYVTGMAYMFNNCNNLTSLDVSNFNTSKANNMYAMFADCYNLTSLDVSNFNTSNVTRMQSMFYNCTNLTTLDVSNFNTSNVINMSYMFNGCTNLTTLDLSNWDTSNVTNMSFMFFGCNELTSLDVSNFDTSNVTIMDCMFYYCKKLLALDVSNFDTSKVKNMAYMFCECNNLTSLDVSNFNTSKVTDMYAMFANCAKLTSLRCPNLTTDSLTSIGRIFKGNTNLVTLDISNLTIDTSIVTDYTEIFLESPNIKYVKCNNIDTINLVVPQLPTKSSTSQGTIICKSDITNLDMTTLQSKYWNILDEPTLIAKYVFDKSIHNNCIPKFNAEFEGYFIEDEVVEGNNEIIRTIESCGMLPTLMKFTTANNQGHNADGRELALLHVEYINNINFTTEYLMFRSCSNLISVKGFVSNIMHNLKHTFTGCDNLTTLDLVSSWDTSRVTDMSYLFYGCYKLTSLDVGNWDTSQVTNMSAMFYDCYNLTSLDLSNWNSSPTTIHHIFYNCKNLMTLDISNFNMINATDITTNMFYNTPLLTDISVLYMDKSSLQKLVDAIPTDSNKTLWYKDINIDGITHGDNIILKRYMEGNVEIVLNSPLLEGDRIEVKDGKLCHYHKRGMVVLDGSEDEKWDYIPEWNIFRLREVITNGGYIVNTDIKIIDITWNGDNVIGVDCEKHNITSKEEGISLLQANPTTVVYKLAEPYYEDITNLQSAPTLKTYLECSMEIDTNLPIDTNVTYRTNLSSVYVMERELDELDSGTDLGDILEGEVNE